MRKKLMYCSECKIHTVHTLSRTGQWICWCSNIDAVETVAVEETEEVKHESV